MKKWKHLLFLLYFVVYLVWFNYLEKTVISHFHIIHLPLDDKIPFCEFFIVPYMLWYVFVGWCFVYFAIRNAKEFKQLCIFVYIGMTVFLIISTIYPNGQYLRPNEFARNNLFTHLCAWLYTHDTPTNLFPSIHVYNSIAVHLAVWNSKEFKHRPYVRGIITLFMVIIVLSTMFLKQHSVFDVLTAIGLCFISNIFVYHFEWKPARVYTRNKSMSKQKKSDQRY